MSKPFQAASLSIRFPPDRIQDTNRNWGYRRHATGRSMTLVATVLGWAGVFLGGPSAQGGSPVVIVTSREAAPMEVFAAREIRRYVYLRTGQLAPLATAKDSLPSGNLIVVTQQDGPVARAANALTGEEPPRLQAQGYRLKTFQASRNAGVVVTGGSGPGTLYGAYRLAEHLGVRFYMHGDVVPDQRLAVPQAGALPQKGAEVLAGAGTGLLRSLPSLDEVGQPLFALRGIQPFHDFPEGPDWWNRDDYLAVLSQLPKLRMNFFGLHTYPEGAPNAEPTVWIGSAQDIGAGSQVKFSYPSSYHNTLRGNWGYLRKKTGEYVFGAAQLFERDDYSAEVMRGHTPNPATPQGCNEVFSRAADMLREAFEHARKLGVRTCVGTEIPLTIPKLTRDRLKEQGKDPKDPVVVQEVYESIFRRAAQAYPLDYYWFWSPEGWTWEGTKDEQVKAATNDLAAAIAAWKKVQPPFKLATCGWVLGPQQDRAMFDKILPKEMAVSCINREVGQVPVERGFSEVIGRGKWAIPWMEDDPALTSMQLWVGRMRRDAYDARRYGCDGLMGIHWRTRVLGPAVSALAQAAWTQDKWGEEAGKLVEPPRVPGPVGGKHAGFPTNAILETEDGPLYRTVRYDVSAYRLPTANGSCKVTLKFCEPNYKEAGKRVFGVKLQGNPVITNLDIFAKVGQNRALDYAFEGILVTNGWLDIDFVRQVEYPSIAAIAVEAAGSTNRINCGGPAYKDYAADWPEAGPTARRHPPTRDFYVDWARAHFGEGVAEQAAGIFCGIDGRLPRPSDWIEGPGGIRPDNRPWSKVSKDYAFAGELAGLRGRVKGAGNLARFDWWLNTFRYMEAMGELNCKWGEYTNAVGKVKAEKDAGRQKDLARQNLLPLRRETVALLGKVYDHLLATVSNPGELGTIMNWEQHCCPDLIKKPGEELAKLLGEPVPADAEPRQSYRGPLRVIVPTLRSSVMPGENITLKVLILGEHPPQEAAVYWRRMGRGSYAKAPLTLVARSVYSARFGGVNDDLEYYVKVTPTQGPAVVFPATAPQLNQTLTMMEASR